MQPLNDSNAFTVAKSIKLGRDTSDSRLPGSKVPYSNTLSPKQKYECAKDADCAGTLVCRSNKCIDSCTGVTCPGGQKCSTGKCIPCLLGEACGCVSPYVSNSSGACFDPCNPNKCASTTPSCIKSGANYSCACTSSSCGAGKKCSAGSCTNCAANEACNCPDGQKANSSGGCAAVACTSTSCGEGKQCANPGTISSYCYNCSANEQCTCSPGQVSNGSGGCVKPVCYDNTPCDKGRQCVDPGKHNARCDPCPPGTQCTCSEGQVADGSGGCQAVKQKGCPMLCPDDIVINPDGSKGGRWCGVLPGATPDALNNGWIGPWAVYESNIIGNGVNLNDHAVVLGNTEVHYSTITGDVIIGGPDCNTRVGWTYIVDSTIAGNGIRIYGGTNIRGCWITGRVHISGARIESRNGYPCYVEDDAFIGDVAQIRGSRISQHAEVTEKAQVINSTIFGNAQIYGHAYVQNSAVGGDAKVCGNVTVSDIVLTTCDKRYCSDCP